MISLSHLIRGVGLLLLSLWLVVSVADAETLQVPEGAPQWMHWGAATLLYLHIGGGAVGLASGVTAVATRKGRRLHRLAGNIFLISMAVTYAIGAGVAPFLETGQRPNFVAGVLALYLLFTGWRSVQQRGAVTAGTETAVGALTALVITAMGALFAWMGANDPSGTVDGSPPQAFILFLTVGTFALAGEIHLLLRKRLVGAPRLARHLWRMCASFFIASGSLFLGQPDVFPDEFNQSLWPFLLAFAPIIAMAVWLVLVRLGRKRAGAATAQ